MTDSNFEKSFLSEDDSWKLNSKLAQYCYQLDGSQNDISNMKILKHLSNNLKIQGTSFHTSNKLMNKVQKAYNGNRQNNIKIGHWNGGSKLWQNKNIYIEVMLELHRPDICFLSEANLWNGLLPHEREILGYKLFLTDTMTTLNHSRIVAIVRGDLEVTIMDKYKNNNSAAIWLKIGRTKKDSIVVGGLYREFKQLGTDQEPASRMENLRLQENRWRELVRTWRRVGREHRCVIIGDLNIDYKHWDNPANNQAKLIELVQQFIEPEGFTQIVQGTTRSWRTHQDSLLDHVWVNCPQRVLNHNNTAGGPSDHNFIDVTLAMKDITAGGTITRKRPWKRFDSSRCLRKLESQDWSSVLDEVNPELANSQLEEIILNILDTEAPMVNFQNITNFSNWLTTATKKRMIIRDETKEKARITDTPED